jgi:hypothetical protein
MFENYPTLGGKVMIQSPSISPHLPDLVPGLPPSGKTMIGALYSGGLIIWGGEAYIWNEVSIIFRGLHYTVEKSLYFLVIDTHFWVHIEQLNIHQVLMSNPMVI